MDTFVCGKCGYVAFKEAPGSCPVCGAKKEAFLVFMPRLAASVLSVVEKI